nr:hypothetical protein [Burkholderia cepacia]
MPVGLIGPQGATDDPMRVAERIAHAVASTGIARVAQWLADSA